MHADSKTPRRRNFQTTEKQNIVTFSIVSRLTCINLTVLACLCSISFVAALIEKLNITWRNVCVQCLHDFFHVVFVCNVFKYFIWTSLHPRVKAHNKCTAVFAVLFYDKADCDEHSLPRRQTNRHRKWKHTKKYDTTQSPLSPHEVMNGRTYLPITA